MYIRRLGKADETVKITTRVQLKNVSTESPIGARIEIEGNRVRFVQNERKLEEKGGCQVSCLSTHPSPTDRAPAPQAKLRLKSLGDARLEGVGAADAMFERF